MSLLRDSAIVGAATFLVGSVLMEINVKQEGEPVGWWPYAGTFIAGALGFYLLGATNVVKVKNAESYDFSQKSAESFSAEPDRYYGQVCACGEVAGKYPCGHHRCTFSDSILAGTSCPLCFKAESFSADQNEDLSGIKQFMAEVFEADRKARRRTTLTWARGMEQGFMGDDDFLKQPRPYEVDDYYGSSYKNENAYHISGLPPGYHIHLWKPRRRSQWWEVKMKSPNSELWDGNYSKSKSRIMPKVLKWYNDAIAAPIELELTPIQQLMIGQGMISGETQIHRIEIPATIQKKKNKITGKWISKTIIAGKIQYYYSGGENDSEPTLFATYDGMIEFELNTPPASIANFCRGLIYLDTETAGNLRSVNRYNKDRKQWVASHPAWFQNMCKQGINSLYFTEQDGTYSVEDTEFLRFYGTHSLSEIKTLDLGNGIEKPMFQVRTPLEDGEEVVDDGWITPRPSTQRKMYENKGHDGTVVGFENEVGIFNKCVAKYQPQEWASIRWDMLESRLLDNTEGFILAGSEPAGHIMCRRFKKK